MLPVRARDVVVRTQSRETANRDRLLSYVQVAETPDLPQAVCLPGLLLESPDQQHLPEPAPILLGMCGIKALGLGFGAWGVGAGHYRGSRMASRDPSCCSGRARGP